MADKRHLISINQKLLQAVTSNNFALAKVALIAGASIRTKNSGDYLTECAIQGNADMAGLILDYAKEPLKEFAASAIDEAYKAGKTSVIELIVQKHLDLIEDAPEVILTGLFRFHACDKQTAFAIADKMVSLGYSLEEVKTEDYFSHSEMTRMAHFVIRSGVDGALDYLLSRGVNISAEEMQIHTAPNCPSEIVAQMEAVFLAHQAHHIGRAASMDATGSLRQRARL